MRIHGSVIVEDLIEEHPVAEEVLSSYGVDFIDDDLECTLREICGLYSLKVKFIIEEIRAAIQGRAWGDGDD